MTNQTNYKKAFEELQEKFKEQEEGIKIKNLLLEVASYMGKSKMTEEEKCLRVMNIQNMTIPQIEELRDILKKEVHAYNEIYLNALEKEQTEG